MAHLTSPTSIRFSFAYVKLFFVFSSPIAFQQDRPNGLLPLPQLLPESFWLPRQFFSIVG
jgi:hypothetical protein